MSRRTAAASARVADTMLALVALALFRSSQVTLGGHLVHLLMQRTDELDGLSGLAISHWQIVASSIRTCCGKTKAAV